MNTQTQNPQAGTDTSNRFIETWARRKPATRQGMTLVELLLSVAVSAVTLGGITLISESLRTDTSDQQTRRTLRLLRRSLTHYHNRHAAWPSGPTTADAIRSLQEDPEAAAMLRPLRPADSPQHKWIIRDGYDRPIRYAVGTDGNTVVADFVSAGPDGRFGDLASDHPKRRLDAMDNLYGSDLEAPTP